MQVVQHSKPPIIIVGCPRSGTLLFSRIIGEHPDNFLITEHGKKERVPEDASGIVDSELWRNHFQFTPNPKSTRPLIETPLYDREVIEKVKNIYKKSAGTKRLVIKNPTHLVRISFLREMFPDALFVFCIRAPWPTIQSITKKRGGGFLLRSKKSATLPDDLLLKAAHSWGESVKIYEREKDDRWIVAQYERIMSGDEQYMRNIFSFLDMEVNETYLKRAIQKIRRTKRNFYPVKRSFKISKYKPDIMRTLEPGSISFHYDVSPRSLPGNALAYYSNELYRRGMRKVRYIFGLSTY